MLKVMTKRSTHVAPTEGYSEAERYPGKVYAEGSFGTGELNSRKAEKSRFSQFVPVTGLREVWTQRVLGVHISKVVPRDIRPSYPFG